MLLDSESNLGECYIELEEEFGLDSFINSKVQWRPFKPPAFDFFVAEPTLSRALTLRIPPSYAAESGQLTMLYF